MRMISEKEVLDIIEFEEKWLMETDKSHGDILIALDSIKSKIKDKSIEPCENAISRVEMIKIADELECVDGIINAEKLRTEICLMPYVQPKAKVGKWIPVSERLPEPFEFVNCTCHSLIDDREDWVVETVYVPQPLNSPYSDWGNIPILNWKEAEVVAWMHRDIPKPYKAESEE